MWKHWKFRYLTLVILSLIFASYLAASQTFHNFILHLGTLEYLGAFLAGILFVSSFTLAASIVVIVVLAQDIHPLTLALIGGLGATLGDLLIFKFVKDHLTEELSMLFGSKGTAYLKSIFKSKYTAWTLPIVGALIIASPLPDELGISILGFSKISTLKLAIISFLSNTFGILAIASIARVL